MNGSLYKECDEKWCPTRLNLNPLVPYTLEEAVSKF